VVTLMTDEQVPDVRDLTRKAGIRPTTTRLAVGDPLLMKIAPGERAATVLPIVISDRPERQQTGRRGGAAKRQSPARRQASPAKKSEGGRKAAVVARPAASIASFSAGSRAGRRGR
jgi:hypothetical protein